MFSLPFFERRYSSRATTRTVVVSSLAVLALDFVLTAMMFSI